MSDQCQSSRRLRPIRGEERTIPVMEFPARNDRHATQVKTKMQRGKPCLISKIYMQETMQAPWLKWTLIAIMILRKSRFLCASSVFSVSLWLLASCIPITTETQRTLGCTEKKREGP